MFGKSTELDKVLRIHNEKVHELKKLLAKKPKSCKMDCREHDDCKLYRNKTEQIRTNRKKLLVGVNNYSVSVIAAVESRMGEVGPRLLLGQGQRWRPNYDPEAGDTLSFCI